MAKVVYLKKNASDKFEALMEGFKSYLEETGRGGSLKPYLGDVGRFASWFAPDGNFSPNAASPLDLVQYRQYLQDQGKAPATVNRALISLKVFFGWLARQGAIRSNPAEGVRPVAEAARLAPGWLARAQQAALMRAVMEGGSLRDEAIIGIMLHAGLRVSEVCALKREDLHIGERAGRVIVRQGKGNKYREVPLNKTARKVLSIWLKENLDGPLFPNRNGGPIGVRGVFYLVAEYAYRAKLPGVTPHSLRHTF